MFVYEEEIFEYWGSFFNYVIDNKLHPITIETDDGELVTFDKNGNVSIDTSKKKEGWFSEFVSCKIPVQPTQKFDELIIITKNNKLNYEHKSTVNQVLNKYKEIEKVIAILPDNEHVDIWIKEKGD